MKKVALVIMDGVGITDKKEGNAFLNANTPNIDYLLENHPHKFIYAHGTHVGLPSDDDMGNSEVGHNAMGCGQIYSQGAKLVNESINSGEIFNGNTWKEVIEYSSNTTLHFIGLLSDGNVHSNINHLLIMLEKAKEAGVKKVRVHILLDGRDVDETSALTYVDMLENKLNELNDETFDGKIASGGGRMNVTMDRYEANWSIVEKGWHAHVLGDAREFSSAREAIETYREDKVIDQYLDSFVIVDDNGPVGTINDGDGVIFFNFRGDRAIEISRAFDEENFDKFDRIRSPKVMYAGMLQYDSELQIPKNYLLDPPNITNTLTEELVKNNINEYAISETQKFGHVTYFWNGNKIDKFNEELETYELVDSDKIEFDKAPEMKAEQITDKFIEALKSDKYQFLRLNYPNGDMVGHTGNYEAAVKSMEAVDRCVCRIMREVELLDDYYLIVTADHGNCEEMIDKNGKAKTSHTTNKVPFVIFSKDEDFEFKDGEFGLANLASTVCDLLEVESNPIWEESMIEKR